MKTLADLKAENATETEVETKSVEEVETVETEPEVEEVESTEEVSETEEAETEEESTEEQEDWLKGDSKESQSDTEVDYKRIAHGVQKQRTELKGRVKELTSESQEKDEKIAQLEALLAAQQNVISPAQELSRPDRYSFDSDEDYEKAFEKYQDYRLDSRLDATFKAAQQAQLQEQARKDLSDRVDAHYEEVAEVIAEHNVPPEVYRAGDTKLRQAIESVMPNQGDAVTDSLLANLGKGSAKVAHHLGINEEARAVLISKLLSDPNGIQASMYLGELKGRLNGKQVSKISSKAPKPAARVKGGDAPSKGESKLKKAYDEATKKKDAQKAFTIRQEARRAGINVKTWN